MTLCGTSDVTILNFQDRNAAPPNQGLAEIVLSTLFGLSSSENSSSGKTSIFSRP